MSIKVSTFASIITNPLNVHNFIVDIPGVPKGSIVVSASSFPSEKLQSVVLHFQGEEVRYPTIPKNDGEWRVKVPESDSGVIRRELDKLKSAKYNQITGTFNPVKWEDVTVTARDLNNRPVFSCILHGVWLQGRDTVDLQNSDPTRNWEWDYSFRYQWIEDTDLNNSGSQAPI